VRILAGGGNGRNHLNVEGGGRGRKGEARKEARKEGKLAAK